MKRIVACQSQLFSDSFWYVASGKSRRKSLDQKGAAQYARKLDMADAWRRLQALEVFEGRPKPSKRDEVRAWDERWEVFQAAERKAGRL